MQKTILLTGATDGIGLEALKILVLQGHTLLLHGRDSSKLAHTKNTLTQLNSDAHIETLQADLLNLDEVDALASAIKERHSNIDVLINNAGVFKTPQTITSTGHDSRFIVNTIAPYWLTKQLLSILNTHSRVINVSSAAQAPVSLDAVNGQQILSDSDAYAQSKLAITMWTCQLAKTLGNQAPVFIAINPGSFLGSKMVTEAYGLEGKDLKIGADILVRAALDDEFSKVTGQYFDNDSGQWAQPHPDALNHKKNNALIATIENILLTLRKTV